MLAEVAAENEYAFVVDGPRELSLALDVNDARVAQEGAGRQASGFAD